jgi:single-strand DNA-binding protein
MKGFNRVTILGNIGNLVTRQAGNANVCEFSVAVTEKTKNGEKTEWVPCVAWDKLADIASSYLRKGSPVLVDGKFTTRSWEDKNGGGKRYKTEVLVRDLVLLSGSRDESEPRDEASSAPRSVASAMPSKSDDVFHEDDLPF